MSDQVRLMLAGLSDGERRELLTGLARAHFAATQTSEVEIKGDEGEILGYLTPPGVRACIALGLDPKNVPQELTGPLYPAGSVIRRLERLEAEAAKVG